MPKPAIGNGPWGEAVEYWLKEKKIRQADLARMTGIEAKIISKIARGFHTSTRSLERIAIALELPLYAVLVSPDRKSAAEERKLMIQEITERVVRSIDTTPSALPPLPPALAQKVKELGQLTEAVEAERQQASRGRSKAQLRRKK